MPKYRVRFRDGHSIIVDAPNKSVAHFDARAMYSNRQPRAKTEKQQLRQRYNRQVDDVEEVT